MSRLPWLKFYPADWLSDSVAGCSLAARGLWIDLLCIMHKSSHYGYLESDGKAIPDELLARQCGCVSMDEYRALLAELFTAGVPSRTPQGIIYNRRMVRDQENRQGAAERQRKHRSHASVTRMSQEEVRSQRLEVREKQTPVRVQPGNTLEQETKEAGFEAFWECWPKKQAKQDAIRAWMKIPLSEYPAIMAGLEKWRKSDQWTRGVIPHASTWLNKKRWQDEDVPEKGANDGNHSAAAVKPESGKYTNVKPIRATA